MALKDFSTYFETDEYLFKQGDRANYAFIIESGIVEVSHHQGDRKLVLSNLGEGDVLGEMSIIDKTPRTATAQAIEPTRVLAIPLDFLNKKIEDSDPTIRLFLRHIMVRYRDTQTRFTHVFDGIESLDDNSEEDTQNTVVFRNVMAEYRDIRDRISNSVNIKPPCLKKVGIVSEDTLLNSKLIVTQDKSLKSALEDDEFFLLFQPIVNLKTKKLAGCEALIRWTDSSGNMIPPSEFIPRAEATGLIVDLGYWIARTACDFQNRLVNQFQKSIFVSINLSGKQFEDPFLVDSLADIMNESGAANDLIKFEITESLLMDNPEYASDVLQRLKKTGISLAIDDFGTGYSSFSYLHKFPFDTLKIDRSFISAMSSSVKSNEIVKTLVNLAHDLKMDVVAEGIESKFEVEMLRHHGADLGQGYYYSRPIRENDFLNLISKRPSVTPGATQSI